MARLRQTCSGRNLGKRPRTSGGNHRLMIGSHHVRYALQPGYEATRGSRFNSYPSEFEMMGEVRDGFPIAVRPIRPGRRAAVTGHIRPHEQRRPAREVLRLDAQIERSARRAFVADRLRPGDALLAQREGVPIGVARYVADLHRRCANSPSRCEATGRARCWLSSSDPIDRRGSRSRDRRTGRRGAAPEQTELHVSCAGLQHLLETQTMPR